MNKNALRLIFWIVICFIGLITLLNSISLGINEASNIVISQGGSIDNEIYLVYLEQSIIKYRVIGLILSILGGIGISKNEKI